MLGSDRHHQLLAEALLVRVDVIHEGADIVAVAEAAHRRAQLGTPDPEDLGATVFASLEPQDIRSLTNLLLRVRRDDGAVAYVNGTEVWRSNMPPGPIDFHTYSAGLVSYVEETTFVQADITAALPLLASGTNVMAVEVHHTGSTSVPDLAAKPTIDITLGVLLSEPAACDILGYVAMPRWLAGNHTVRISPSSSRTEMFGRCELDFLHQLL